LRSRRAAAHPFGHGACLCVGVNQRATSLGQALQVVGDMPRLAALLGVRKEKLCGWLCGEEQPPWKYSFARWI